MGRGCTMDEWVHFEKLPEEGRVPNSSYWYVLCRHCVRSYEHKQLVNPPSKLTGRRSAMRAHLKVCPVYAAQYKLEQGLANAAAAATAAAVAVGVAQPTVAVTSVSTSTTPMAEAEAIEDKTTLVLDEVAVASASTDSTPRNEVRRRKSDSSGDVARGGRGKHCMMEEWEHFIRLQDDGYIGKSNFFYAICKHCQKAYDDAPEEKKLILVPERMVGRREKMRKHLSLCPFFKGVLPPLERRGINSRNPVTAAALQAISASGTPTGIGNVAATGASAAATGVVHSDVTVSSRLALDEWQYFTRLHRKPDSAYYYARCNFCQDAHLNAPPALQASMTPTIVMGRKSNMQTHLAKCPHVPKDIFMCSSTPTEDGVHSGDIRFRDDYAGFRAAKRQKLPEEAVVDADQTDLAGLYDALVEFTIQHELPFEWIGSPSTRKLFNAASMTSELASILPTAEDLRGPILNELLTSVLTAELTRLKEPVSLDAPNSSDILDAPVTAGPWPLIMQVSVAPSENAEALHPTLESTLINGKMRIPVRYLPHFHQNTTESGSTSIAHYHGLEVARWVEEQLDHCTTQEKIVPSIVMFPFSPVYERAAGILLSRRPNIVCMHNFDDLLLFCQLKMLQSVDVQALVSSLVELWGVDTIREHIAMSDPFQDWRSCSRFMQVLLDEKAALESKSAELKELIDDRIDWELLERGAELYRSFENAFDSFLQGDHFGLADILIHLQSLFSAARGFGSVLRALETVWWQLEQPLIILTYALHPYLRLRNVSSTKLTKLSVLSDLSVKYFEIFFGHKASSLRGEMTAYLHSSQPVFARTFVSEFPVVEDYFRYLSDDFSSLSMLMRMLHAFSVIKIPNKFTTSNAEATKMSALGYSSEEQQKMAFIKEYRKITQRPGKTEDTKPSPAVSIDLTDATSVMERWIKNLQARVSKDWIDFASLEQRYELDDVAIDDEVQTSTELEALESKLDPLPTRDMDDIVAYPSALLRGDRAKKVRLRDLFKPAEATI